MKDRSLSLLLAGIASIVLTACSPAVAATSAPTVVPVEVTGAVAVTAVRPTETATPNPTPTTRPTPLPTVQAEQGPTSTPAATATLVPPAPAAAVLPARLVIPNLKLDVPVREMTWSLVNTPQGQVPEWNIPQNAAGHASNSALLGQQDNVVISGHNNIYGRVFMKISQIWPSKGYQAVDAFTDRSAILDGQEVDVYGADGRRFAYVITDFFRVKDSGVTLNQRLANGRFIQRTDRPQLTLTTCWPPWSNTYRLVIIAQPAA